MKAPKVFVLGLDCAEPSLLFGPWLEHLPNFRRMVLEGRHGLLRSCDPPITVPAWSVMMSSRSPGALGVYGFRNRVDHSYDKLSIATSTSIQVKRLWDFLGQAGKKVVLIGIPQTYPPLPVNGCLVGDFLTPNVECDYTFPRELKEEIRETVGEYLLDVREFRSENKDKILADIYEMTEKRFRLASHFLKTKPWDYFMMVEMGTDRIHHAFWSYLDAKHRDHEPGHRFANAIFDYYKFLDRKLGELLRELPPETHLFVVSDHGAARMDGGICINDWLIREGYLCLRETPSAATPLAKARIDWSKTRAWGDGGYYARIFLNVQGREPEGIVPPEQYESLRRELAQKIVAIPDEKGRPLPTQVHRPEDLYRTINGVAPDLLVYFGGLHWRSNGTVGNKTLHTFENDTGPDDANHAQYGLLIYRPPGGANPAPDTPAKFEDARLVDITPTLLRLFGLQPDASMEGTPLSLI
jgi:predicted AlkP superfamily phosphohydrolase/phosphomutase